MFDYVFNEVKNLPLKIMKSQRKSKAFTLVELLIVIAIIGVLAGLIFPSLTKVMGVGSRAKSMNNARNIANSWISYTKTGTSARSVYGKDIYDWAGVLAERAGLNDAVIWILDFDTPVMDKRAEGAPMPLTVANQTGANWQINPEFKAFPLSFEVANRMDPNAPSGTPLVWTRGLKSSGYWDKNTGVFKDEGGHVAFTDGHVEWFDSLRDENSRQGKLRIYNGTGRTFNIAQAIRGGSGNILKSKVDVYSDEESEE